MKTCKNTQWEISRMSLLCRSSNQNIQPQNKLTIQILYNFAQSHLTDKPHPPSPPNSPLAAHFITINGKHVIFCWEWHSRKPESCDSGHTHVGFSLIWQQILVLSDKFGIFFVVCFDKLLVVCRLPGWSHDHILDIKPFSNSYQYQVYLCCNLNSCVCIW